MLHHLGNRPRRVVVCDLSTGGFRTLVEDPVRPGKAVTLEMDGFAPISGYVVWQEDGLLGCAFVNDLHPAIVEAAVAVSASP